MDSLLDPNVSALDMLGQWAGALLAWRPDGSMVGPNLILIPLAILGYWMSRRGSKKASSGSKREVKLPRRGRHWFWGAFARHEHRVGIVGALFDVMWRHIGIVGTSGSKKSTLIAMLLEAIDKPFAALTGDHSPPLLNFTLWRGGRVWTPRGSEAWYPWGGLLEAAVQRVEFLFPASGADVGVHRAMFRLATRLAWAPSKGDFEKQLEVQIKDPDAAVQAGQRTAIRSAALQVGVAEDERSVEQIMALLPVVARGSSSKMMTDNWIPRLLELVLSLGDSIRTRREGGFDLTHELRRGRDVLFAINSFTDVSNRERFAKIAALEMLRAADVLGTQPKPISIVAAFDEVGLLGAELFSESVRTLRVRLCTGIFASHIADDFQKLLKGLITVWFLGTVPGSDKATREWESSTIHGMEPPEHFDEHVLNFGDFWLTANGRVQKVTIPTWQTRPQNEWLPFTEADDPEETPDPTPDGGTAGTHAAGDPEQFPEGDSLDEIELVDSYEPIPGRIAADARWLKYWERVTLRGGHRLSNYRLNNQGRPMVTIQRNGQREDWLLYILMKAVAEGRDLDEVRARTSDNSSEGLTVDHLCRRLDPGLSVDDEIRCIALGHLRWKTRGGHTKIEWERGRPRLPKSPLALVQ